MSNVRRLRPLLAAGLAVVLAVSSAQAVEPSTPPHEPRSWPVAEDALAAGAASGRVIVVLRPGADSRAAAGRARELGVRVQRTFSHAVRAYAAEVSRAQLRQLTADPQVAAIVADERIEDDEGIAIQLVPSGVRRVYADVSPTARIDGLDERVDADVAIFDTGIDPTHPDLNVAGGYNCTSADRANWQDGHGHGTHVAGIVGALDNGHGVVGVAPGVRLWSVRILDAQGSGFLSWWICGLDWIAAQSDPSDPSRPLFEAVNMSVTRRGGDDGNCGRTRNDVLHQAICRVFERGITIVASAGNDSGPASERTPAAYDEVITVSALADVDGRPGGLGGATCWTRGIAEADDAFASFSNHGPDVDLIAPGACIESTVRHQSFATFSGTSMAAPHVTGAAALYLASRPGAPPPEVRGALRHLGSLDWNTATDPDGDPDILLDLRRLGPLGDFTLSATLPATEMVADELGAAWTIPLAVGRGPGFIEPVTFSVAGNPAPVAAAISGPTVLLGDAAETALTITVPPATPAGTYEIAVQAAYRTLLVREIRFAVTVTNEAPVAFAPRASLTRGSRASHTGVPLRITWPAAADQSPIAGYELGEVPSGLGVDAVTSVGTTATASATRTIPFATERTYAVRAIDRPGNVSQWAVGPPVQVRVVSESSREVVRSAGWRRFSATNALGGRFLFTDRSGTWMRFTFQGTGIAVVGRRGPTHGRAEIRIDGVRVATVSARAATLTPRVLLFAAAVDPSRPHTIEVRVLATAGRPRIDVDAFLVVQ
jgi:subtilisin family serine protease